MIRPLYRILSSFLFTVGFLVCVSGGYAFVFGGGSFVLLFTRLALGLAILVAGFKAREASGDLELVLVDPEDLANFFEVAKAYGLGANAHPGISFLLGFAAAGLITLAFGALGLISPGALALAVGIIGLHGGLVGLFKRRSLKRGVLIKKDGKLYGAHRRLNVYLLPVIVVVWLVVATPGADPIFLLAIAAGLLFWIGRVFHPIWEALHIAGLVLVYGENQPRTIEWGLFAWLRHSRFAARPEQVVFHGGKVTLTGEFDRADELKRDLLRFDFIDEVEIKAPLASGL